MSSGNDLESDLYGSEIASPSAASISPLESDLYGPEQPGISDRLNADYSRIGDEAVQKLQNPNLNDLGRAGIDAQTGLNYGWSIPKEGAISVYNALPEPVRNTLSAAGSGVQGAVAHAWGNLPQPTRDEISSDAGTMQRWLGSLAQEHPNIASVLGVAGSVAPAKQAIDSGVKLASEYGPEFASTVKNTDPRQFLGHEGSGGADVMPTPRPTNYTGGDFQEGISNAFMTNLDRSGKYYDFANEIAQGRAQQAPQVKEYLGSVINDIRKSVAPHEASASVGKLESIYNKLPDDGTVPISDLLDLRKFTNKEFNPKRLSDKDSVYAGLNKQVDSGLQAFGVKMPEFNWALNAADDFWRNSVKKPFLDNKVLEKVWSPDDAHNMRMAKSGYLDELPDETKQRANNLLSGIKDVDTYNAVRRSLPDNDVGAGFDRALRESIANNDGVGRAGSAVKTVKGALNLTPSGMLQTVRNVSDTIAPRITPVQKQILNAIKSQDTYTPLEDKLTAADQKLQELKNFGYGNPRFSVLGPKAIEQEKRLALPAPDPVIAVDRNGSARPINTDSGLAKSGSANRVRSEKLGLTNDVRAAQDANYKSNLQKRYGQSDVGRFAVENRYEPVERLTNADKASEIDSGAHSGVLSGNPDDEGFKRGGAVPTEAQKMAGNYKKYHVKWQGLNIAIENPAGSERSGIGKDGKKWSVTMPHHYGYLKRTIGADGDHVDCFLGPNQKSRRVYVIDQKDAESGAFDEHKCMISFTDRDAAVAAYRSAFSDKKNRIMKVTRMSVDEFKQWLRHGDTKKPAKRAA